MKPDAVTDCSRADAHFAPTRSTPSIGNRPAPPIALLFDMTAEPL